MQQKENNGIKKLFVFSNLQTKEFVEEVLTSDAKNRNTTQSAIIEELLLKGIGLSHPELLSTARELYKKNLDPFLLGEDSKIHDIQENGRSLHDNSSCSFSK